MYPSDATANVAMPIIALPADDGARESVTDPTKINMIMGIITDLWT
jgi:hypothetical protein